MVLVAFIIDSKYGKSGDCLVTILPNSFFDDILILDS